MRSAHSEFKLVWRWRRLRSLYTSNSLWPLLMVSLSFTVRKAPPSWIGTISSILRSSSFFSIYFTFFFFWIKILFFLVGAQHMCEVSLVYTVYSIHKHVIIIQIGIYVVSCRVVDVIVALVIINLSKTLHQIDWPLADGEFVSEICVFVCVVIFFSLE